MFRIAAGLLAISVLAASHEVRAQGRTLRVVSTQGTPIPFATAWIEGGTARIADSTGTIAIGNVVHPVDTADVAAIDGRHVVAAVRAYLGGAATTADGVSVDVEAPLRWVAPSRYQPSAGAPPRDRLLLWTDRFVRFPVVTVLQGGRILASKRLWWPAAPGRVFRVPAALLRGATRTDGTITIRVR